MISESGSVEAMLRAPGLIPPFTNGLDHSRLDRLDPMQNQLCRVCDEPAAGFHFGAFTCEGCKSFFGRTCNNQSVIQECKNNYRCVVDKKNRTACKACRLRKCLMVGMSKSGSRYGRRSNWFKIHCLMQQNMNGAAKKSPTGSSSTSSLSPTSAPPPPMPTLPSSAPPPPLPQPSSLWHSPPKSESREATPPNLPNSPEPPAHRPFTTASSLLPPPPAISTLSPSPTASASPDSPFKAYIPPSLSPSKPIAPTPLATPTALPSVPAAPPLTSLYSGFPLASLAAFPGIPLHKQALLSPLLAHSHLWQMAAASRHPLLAGLAAAKPELSASSPGLDLLAEHKALMERFAAATQVAAAAAAAAAAASGKEEIRREEDDADSVASRRSPASSVAADAAAPSPAEPQNAPMDLSGPRKELLEVSSSSEDVNRNRLVKSEETLLVDLCAKKKASSPPASL